MTQPLNYTVKALECFASFDATATPLSRAGFRYLAEKLRQAQVFVMPEYGILLDRTKSRPEVPGLTFQPSFPVVALEYAAPAERGRSTPGYTDAPSSKRIALAWRWQNDLPPALRGFVPAELADDAVVVASICYLDQSKLWVPIPAAAHFAFDATWAPPKPMPYVAAAIASGQMSKAQLRGNSYPYSLVPLLPEALAGVAMEKGPAGMVDHIASDLMDEVSAYLDLCYALSCRNVQIERQEAPEKLNRARLRRGDLPLKDFHVLKLDGVDNVEGGREGVGNADGGRRAHLRRGHIRHLRHLAEGRFTWVNATMVSGRGFIDKVYAA